MSDITGGRRCGVKGCIEDAIPALYFEVPIIAALPLTVRVEVCLGHHAMLTEDVGAEP